VVLGLERYCRINNGESVAKFQIVKRMESERPKNLDDALEIHKELKKEFKRELRREGDNIEILNKKIPSFSFLDLKIYILFEMLKSCNFCERRCGVNRYETVGFCKCGVKSYYSTEFYHLGEEPELVPSHTIFFNRCTFGCVYCQNYDIVYRDDYEVDPKEMARIIDARFRGGSRNVNFVGGNPDQHSHTILQILKYTESNIPVVWNSNMYHSLELAEIIEDIVDVWLGDFKYGNDTCALKYSKAPNYWRIITRNFLRAKDNGELLIRHLVLPNHLECCTEKVIEWVSKNIGKKVRFNLMFQYYPTFRAYEYKEISRRLNGFEMKKALEIAEKWGLENLV